MMKTYLLLGALVVCSIIIFLAFKRKTSNDPESERSETLREGNITNPYSDLRDMAFEVTPETLGLTVPEDPNEVFGVIMDWGISGSVATLVTFITGDTSLYLGSGGGLFGGGKNDSVAGSAKKLVASANSYLSQAQMSQDRELPGDKMVKFYLLTHKCIYLIVENEKNFENGTSGVLDFFSQANEVLTKLRETSGTP